MGEKLDSFVEENRFTISVIFPVVGAAGFIASAELNLPGVISFNAFMILFGTLVMRLPLVAGLKPLADKKALLGLCLLSVYAYLIEFVGLETGWPYGSFEYLIDLGPMVEGVPIGLPVFFIPLVINSFLVVNLVDVRDWWKRIPLKVSMVLMIDLVLDPAAVSLGIWSYSSSLYYGVPLSNFFGWIVSGTVAVIILETIFERSEILERLENQDYMLDDLVSFVFLWGVVNVYYLNVLPVSVALFLSYLLYTTDRFDFAFEGVLERFIKI